MDTQVETMAEKVCKQPPAAKLLNPEQRRIVEMLIEHMRNLPPLQRGENCYNKPEYRVVNSLLTDLFGKKYPEWTKKTSNGLKDVDAIPNGEGAVFALLLRELRRSGTGRNNEGRV